MRLLITIGLFIIVTSSHVFSMDVQDSIKVDRKKVEKVIRKIKKRREIENSKFTIKDFDKRKVTFSYPDKFAAGQCTSLSENTIPDPEDKIKMQSKDFDAERFKRATLQFKQEFESVKRQIERSTKKR